MKKDKRVVEYMLCRKPDAPFLDKTNPPYGQRTPNCTIGGHSLCDFFWLERGEGSYIFTIWSRSMIRERGEGYIDEDPRKEPPPRKRKPWPLLKLPKRLKAESKRNGFGRIDPGSDYDSDGLECFDVLDDVDSDYEGRAKALSSRDSFKILRTSIASPCLCWFSRWCQVKKGYNKDWPSGRLEIVFKALDQDETTSDQPKLVVFSDINEAYFVSGLDCLTCLSVGTYACPECTAEPPSIVSVLRYNTPKPKFVENKKGKSSAWFADPNVPCIFSTVHL